MQEKLEKNYKHKKSHELCLEFPTCNSNNQWTKLLLFHTSRFDQMALKVTETKAAVDCLWKCYQVSFDFSRFSYVVQGIRNQFRNWFLDSVNYTLGYVIFAKVEKVLNNQQSFPQYGQKQSE